VVFNIRLKYGVTIAPGDRLALVKCLRTLSDERVHPDGYSRYSLGLKEAVEMAHALIRGEVVPFEKDVDIVPDLSHNAFFEIASWYPKVEPYIHQCSVYREVESSSMIQAIKDIRSVCGYGLKESKDLIDHMRYTKTPVKIVISTPEVQGLRELGFIVNEPYRLLLDEDLFTD
jgi:hypothetical protein